MKELLRREVRIFLEKLSSEEYQKNEWTKNLSNTWFFPEEIFCEWFDDLFAGKNNYWLEHGIFNLHEIDSLSLVSNALHSFKLSYEKDKMNLPPNLLQYRPWKIVIQKAKKAVQELKQ